MENVKENEVVAYGDEIRLSYDDFMMLSVDERARVLFMRQEYLIDKFEKIEDISHRLDEMFGKVKPLFEKIPTEAIKEKTSAFFGKFKKSEVVSPDMKNCTNVKD